MLADHDVVIPQDVGLEPFQDLAAKLAGGEGVRFLLGVVRVRHVGPVGVEAGGPLLVQAVVDGDVVRAGVVEDCLWGGGEEEVSWEGGESGGRGWKDAGMRTFRCSIVL